MFERFTPDARRAIVLAQELAREAKTGAIEPDDIVGGVLSLPRSLGSWLLTELGVDVADVSARARQARPRGTVVVEGHVPFTSTAKSELEQTLHSATSLGDDHIGTEHLVLVTLVVGRTQIAQLLNRAGVDAARYRAAVEAHPGRVRSGAAYTDAGHLHKAVEHLRAGDGAAALGESEAALADASRSGQQPDLAHSQNLVAWTIALTLLEPRYDEALALVDQALAALPDNDALLGTRWAVLTVMGRGAETIGGQEHLLTLGDDVLGDERGVSHTFLARAHLDAGHIDQARHHLREADRYPHPWPVHADTWRRLDERDGTWLPPGP